MALTPGAVDTGAGNGASVRFFGQGGDDVNYRVDGVDATAVRNQSESKSRLMISEDAIAEFRVNSQLYTAETGGATSAQIEIVSKGGTNQFHGGAFEYLRNSALDSRSPFDGKSIPPFKMNQFGATVGGPICERTRPSSFFPGKRSSSASTLPRSRSCQPPHFALRRCRRFSRSSICIRSDRRR